MGIHRQKKGVKLLGYQETLDLERTDPARFRRLKNRVAKSMERIDIIARAFDIEYTVLSQVVKDKKWKRCSRRFGKGSCD